MTNDTSTAGPLPLYSAAQVREPCLGHNVENRVCVWALQRALAKFGNIHVRSERRVADLRAREGADARAGEATYALLLDDGSELTADLFVDASGFTPLKRLGWRWFR